MRTCITFILFFSFSAFANDQLLKICLTGSTEKAIPKYGEAFVNGAKLAISELKSNDRKRVLLSVNYYESTPLAPLTKLYELQKNDCDAIVGFSTGNDLISIESELRSSPVLTLSLYGDPQDRFIKTNYLRTFQPSAKDLVSFLLKELPFKMKKESNVLFVTAIDRSEMISYRSAYLDALKDKALITNVEIVEQTHDLRQLKEILENDKKWDYVVLLTRSLIAAEVSDLIYQKSNPIILGTKYFGSSDLPAFFDYLKNKNINAFFSRQNCSCDQDKKYLRWSDNYKKNYGAAPMSISLESYDAIKFILGSLGLTRLNKTSILKYLNSEQLGYEGISSIKIDRDFQISSTKRFLIKIDKNGYSEIK